MSCLEADFVGRKTVRRYRYLDEAGMYMVSSRSDLFEEAVKLYGTTGVHVSDVIVSSAFSVCRLSPLGGLIKESFAF